MLLCFLYFVLGQGVNSESYRKWDRFLIQRSPPTINSHIRIKAGWIASKFRYNRLIYLYRSDPVRLYILEIKIAVENSELPPFCKWGQLEISNINVY